MNANQYTAYVTTKSKVLKQVGTLPEVTNFTVENCLVGEVYEIRDSERRLIDSNFSASGTLRTKKVE